MPQAWSQVPPPPPGRPGGGLPATSHHTTSNSALCYHGFFSILPRSRHCTVPEQAISPVIVSMKYAQNPYLCDCAGDVIICRIGDIVPADIKLLGDPMDTSSPLQVPPPPSTKKPISYTVPELGLQSTPDPPLDR